MDSDHFKARIEQIFGDLDRYSYYELLNLSAEAAPDQIRAAFHRMALSVHPDRFQHHDDQELRAKIYAIYKRMTEAYRVLMDSAERRDYNKGLQQGQTRLVRTRRKTNAPKRKADAIRHPKARQFFNMGQDAERRGDLKNAKLNYKFALDMEPDHPEIAAARARVEELEQQKQQKQQ